jgi:hypothetical protein
VCARLLSYARTAHARSGAGGGRRTQPRLRHCVERVAAREECNGGRPGTQSTHREGRWKGICAVSLCSTAAVAPRCKHLTAVRVLRGTGRAHLVAGYVQRSGGSGGTRNQRLQQRRSSNDPCGRGSIPVVVGRRCGFYRRGDGRLSTLSHWHHHTATHGSQAHTAK